MDAIVVWDFSHDGASAPECTQRYAAINAGAICGASKGFEPTEASSWLRMVRAFGSTICSADSSAPDQANNFLALAFGVFITALVVFGSMVIMSNLNHAMVSMDQLMQMQR
jgi:hypothetical protein